MDKEQAQRIVRDTLGNPFDKVRFTRFVKELLNYVEEAPFAYRGNLIPDAYEQYIGTLERIGKYTDGENKIDILVVKLKKETSIDRARTMQRNFIAWYLNGSRGDDLKDAALVAFVSPSMEDWRFSLIRMDYRLEEGKGGRMKVKEEFTLARRWSFLVGKNENSHTAQSRLAPIIADDTRNPALKELEDAFNIEKVTKEFFEKYRELYFQVKEELDRIVAGNSRVREDFEKKGVSTVDFTKKLLGQIVFLYFLQKKGWFGVARDGQWGSGSRHFLRELFEKKHGTYGNFFNDILEPLFYSALCMDRSYIDDYYDKLNCRIPFLNGGLFDPLCGYDWLRTDVLLPNTLFSNENVTSEGDRGDGVLDIFDRYNFTVKEDEPLEKEVAVDPEMLGKVFENLLEVKDRKSKGTYYTPREIVHYMCRQSLINYLYAGLKPTGGSYEKFGEKQLDMFGNEAKTGQLDLSVEHRAAPAISKDDIETLIEFGERLGENEATVEAKGKETGTYSYKLPESVRQSARAIDERLAAIKVLDPAIGSGAFPVGMMSEIVKARNVLSIFIKDNPVAPSTKNSPLSFPPLAKGGQGGLNDRTIYSFKRECIEKSLYGVDVDPGAVEIAKLRLWLSLVVDEDDIRKIKPLPNLDYKIVCGDSLGSVTRDVLNDHLFIELETLKKRYFGETSLGKKREDKARIDALIAELTHDERRFDYHIFFSEVFDHGGGFDVVIANPPYVRQEGIKAMKSMLSKEFPKFYCGTADLYTYFYRRGLQNLKQGGHLCFIAPNKFMRAAYGKNTRTLLTTEATPKTVVDFGDLPIFDATTYPSILLMEKKRPSSEEKALAATFTDASELEQIHKTLSEKGFPMPVSALKADGWTLERPEVLALMEKLRKAGTPLGEYVKGRFYRGILTGLNEAFVIDEATKQRLIAEDPKSAELIKPWLRGRDIKRWKAEWAGLYVIFTRRGTDIAKYPAIMQYLEQFREDLEPKKSDKDTRGRKPGSYKWFEIQDNIAYHGEFEQSKIVYPNITKANIFAFDIAGWFTNQKCFIIPTNDMYLLAVLNSKVGLQWFTKALPLLRGGFFEPSAVFMKDFPIPSATDGHKSSIISLVQRILANPESPDVPRLEAQIDQLVYALYGLGEKEIDIIEKSRV